MRVTVIEPIASGHKVALRRIAVGEPVIKYGSPIGTATAVIAPGAHVHTHNVASSRGRGDLGARSRRSAAAAGRAARRPVRPGTTGPRHVPSTDNRRARASSATAAPTAASARATTCSSCRP